MSRKKKSNNSGGMGNDWINTYADTITLLLTFFILMYSFSTIDAKKFKQIATAFQSVLDGDAGKTILSYDMKDGNAPIVGENIEGKEKSKEIDMKSMYNKVQDIINKNKLNASVQIKRDNRGVIIELKDKILFESGKANLKPESVPILDKVNEIISKIPNDIEIQGHTDNVPISNSNFKDNFELSGARAYSVLKYFLSEKINPNRLNYRGMGQYDPVVSNDTEEHKSMNRRVNILIIVGDNSQKSNQNS